MLRAERAERAGEKRGLKLLFKIREGNLGKEAKLSKKIDIQLSLLNFEL